MSWGTERLKNMAARLTKNVTRLILQVMPSWCSLRSPHTLRAQRVFEALQNPAAPEPPRPGCAARPVCFIVPVLGKLNEGRPNHNLYLLFVLPSGHHHKCSIWRYVSLRVKIILVMRKLALFLFGYNRLR